MSFSVKPHRKPPFCHICFTKTEETVTWCYDCGNCVHQTCFTRASSRPFTVERFWHCGCDQPCSECAFPVESTDPRLLKCQQCRRLFHAHCASPSLKAFPEDGWSCVDCVHCQSCGRLTPGDFPNSTWQEGFKLCEFCAYTHIRYSCGKCQKPYEDIVEGVLWVQCDFCKNWYHGSCIGYNKKHARKAQQSKKKFMCNVCVPTRSASEVGAAYAIVKKAKYVKKQQLATEAVVDDDSSDDSS